MAGIGFELRKYLENDSFTGTLKAYGFAGLISAGPWVLSILGVMLIGVFALSQNFSDNNLKQFTTSVTWIMGASLVLTGLLQLVFTRFVADRLFEKRDDIVNANLFGAIALTTGVSAVIALILAFTVFDLSFSYEFLMAANFVTLSNMWIVVIFVAGLKQFKLILYAFALGYGVTLGLSILLLPYGLNGLLTGMLVGHAVLLFLMVGVVLPEAPIRAQVRFDFLRLRLVFPSLIAIGFLYNLGIWVDKFLFWLTPGTSEAVIGPLRASIIYDLPIFLAYLSIIPGMAVFLLRIETDFAEAYEGFFDAVRGNASLPEIEKLGTQMITSVREGLYQIVRVQGATVVILYLMGPALVKWLGISEAYVHLFYINLVGVAAQVLTLCVTNAVFTWITLQLGPEYYGYGFGVAMMVSAFLGIILLSREMDNIEFHTFMRARHAAGTVA